MNLSFFIVLMLTVFSPPWPEDRDPVEINNEAVRLLNEKQYDRAVGKLIEAHDLDPESQVIVQNLAAAHMNRGIDRGGHSDFSGAIRDFRTARKYSSENPEYAYLLAYYLFRNGELRQAEDVVDKALKWDPGPDVQEKLRRLKGNILYMEDELEGSLSVFEEILKTDSGNDVAERMVSKIRSELDVQREYHHVSTGCFKLFYNEQTVSIGSSGPFVFMLEKERSRVCTDLNQFPRKRTTVIIYQPDDFQTVTESEAWVGGLFDGKIRIPLADLDKDNERIRQIIRHEYTHLIIYELAPGCPSWVNEGLACFEQYTAGTGEKKLGRMLKSGQTPSPFEELPHSFINISDPDKARLYYAQSHAMVEYLVRNYGMGRIRLFLREMNKLGNWQKAFRVTYSREFHDLEREWLARL